MRSEDIAKNIDPLLREYITLAIMEAIQPALEEVYTQIKYLRQDATKAPDTSNLSAQITQTVEASISASIVQNLNNQKLALRQELQAAFDEIKAENARAEASADRILIEVAELDNSIRKWKQEDRYSITRAHVLKAMRESTNG